MLGSVNKMSYGLLSLEPKDKDGNPIENLEDYIIKEDGKELKAWDAITRYMRSFDDTDGDGISNFSKYYASTHDHKVVDDSKNIIDLIKKPNKFSAMIVAIVLVIISSISPRLKSRGHKYFINKFFFHALCVTMKKRWYTTEHVRVSRYSTQ